MKNWVQLFRDLFGTPAGASVSADIATIDANVDTINTNTDTKVAGRTQIFEKSITSAANAGDVNVATITTQPCLIKSVIIHSDTASQTDLTSAGVYGGDSKVIIFIDSADALKADIDAVDEQVFWQGAVRLDATKTIVITLTGSGATAVDLTVIVEYEACANGGYLV